MYPKHFFLVPIMNLTRQQIIAAFFSNKKSNRIVITIIAFEEGELTKSVNV